jgi:steroid delta-isomerase-like uncharacterized protein
MGLDERLRLLARHLDAENAHDLDGIMATYGATPVVEVNHYRFEGAQAVRAFHAQFGFGGPASFSEVQVAERARHLASDGAVVLEQTLSGVHTGTWQGIEPSGRRFEVRVCTVYSFDENDLLASERAYFDRAQILRQLGR